MQLSIGSIICVVVLALHMASLKGYLTARLLFSLSPNRIVHATAAVSRARCMFIWRPSVLSKSEISWTGSPTTIRCSSQKVENGIDLSLLDRFEVDGGFLGSAITRWLDEEYIVQPVHVAIGRQVEDIYVRERRSGVVDLGEMLMQVGTSLEKFDMGNAFVNSWDVANRVADLLIVRMDRELCECAGDLSGYMDESEPIEVKIPLNQQYLDPDTSTLEETDVLQDKIRSTKIRNTIRLLHGEFARLKFLREFLEGDLAWEDMHIAIGIMMGFRLKPGSSTMEQDQALAPYRWEDLEGIPDVGNLDNSLLQKKLTADLPDDEEATDLVIETIAGTEAHQAMKASDDPLIQRRVLVAKWLYTQGFLTDDFPARERFVPHHLADEFEEESGRDRRS